MATNRSYTTIEQSRKLAEILPLESADGHWFNGFLGCTYRQEAKDLYDTTNNEYIPAWSLTALLGVLTKHKICHYDNRYYCQYISEDDEFPIYSTAAYDNPIDACMAMIEKLYELNLL